MLQQPQFIFVWHTYFHFHLPLFFSFLQNLLNLAEQIGEVKPKGLSRAEIDQLPTYRTTLESKKNNEDSRCVVCLMEFEEKQLVRVLPCLHEYHTRCIDKWLKVG